MHQAKEREKWKTGYFVILLVGACLAGFVHQEASRNYESALENYRKQSHADALRTSENMADALKFLYQGIRTISQLPSVKNIDRYGQNLDANTRESIQQIYSNMATNIAVSEVYIVPVDFEPDQIDPTTGSPQAPIMMFDSHIVDNQPITATPLEEVEIEEYHLLRSQMELIKNKYGSISRIEGLQLPLISGPEVLTCDNSVFAETKQDADRRGFVFSVPFYGTDGLLKGTVSAIIRTSELRSLLPSGDYALLNSQHRIKLYGNGSAQATASANWVESGKRDPSLIFSAVLPLKTTDSLQNWTLWAGFPNSHFTKSTEAQAIENFRLYGLGFIALVTLLSVFVWAAQERNFRLMKHVNTELEARVEERTKELAVAAVDLQSSLTKAEDASRSKSDFLANMSHELRTPMNGVLGMAYLLSDTELNDEQRNYVSTINASGEGLLMLLNDILDFSKIEAGALVLEHIAFDLRDTVRKATDLLRVQANAKTIDLRLDIQQDVPEYMWGDAGRMRQILNNLIGNAIKFTDKGYVRLTLKLQEQDNKSLLHVSVEDTGMGIPANKLEAIFEKFTQADASMTRKYGGTGLGLAITKQLVSMMDGHVGVESAEGKGSTFWFTIPCDAAESKDILTGNEKISTRVSPTGHLKPIGEARALLVEDYPLNQIFAEKLLRKFGFRHIDHAEDGVQAIERYHDAQYDIVFMDCQMPRMDGYITTMEVRMIEALNLTHTPIVAMTANAMMGDREKCLKAGMDDYLSKPLRAEHVRKVLENWFLLEEAKSVIAVEKPVQHTEMEEVPVDMDQLRLFTNGDVEEEKMLVDLFLDQATTMLDILKASTAEDAHEAWKSASHRFKGSSGNLGAMKLHHLCKRAETHFADNTAKKLEMLAAIQKESDRIRDYFKTLYAA